MAEDKPTPEPTEKKPPIDPDAAVKEVEDAMAILPKRRLGCLGRFARYGAVVFALLAAFVYWNFLRTPPLVISKETTYITEPLTADGKRVDYFAALEKEFYLPEMKTDDNGYRLIVRALGDVASEGEKTPASRQVYKKLGLDPAIEPSMSFVETSEFLLEYAKKNGLDEKAAFDLDSKVSQPWTLDDLPMLKPWLEKNGPVLDMVAEAVRKPAFCPPLLRVNEEATLVETTALNLSEMQRSRSFARMLWARAHYRIGTGDIDGAIDDVITCKRLGRHMQRQGTIISRLVGIAIEAIASAIGIAANPESPPTKEQLQRLADQLAAIPPSPGMDQMLLVERYFLLDTLQAAALEHESLALILAAWGEGDLLNPGIAAYVSVDWNIVMRRVNAVLDTRPPLQPRQPPSLWSPGNLFLGSRSRNVADLVADSTLPSFLATAEAIRRSTCGDNVQEITLAMLLYHHEHGTLPPAYTVDGNGKPLHSWRVLLLPYLGQEELFGKIRLDEPWDSQHNRQFHGAAPSIYRCPSAGLTPDQTTYSVVVGQKTAFQPAKGKSLDNFGTHLILVAERQQPVCWMDPASELSEAVAAKGINSQQQPAAGLGSNHPGGMQTGFRDGGTQFLSETIDLTLLKGLLDGTSKDFCY